MADGYPEPPAVGSETDTLLGSLERQRSTFAYKCANLTTEQLRVTIGASAITLGGLLKHLAYMEDLNFTCDLSGDELPAPWADVVGDDRGAEVWSSAGRDDATVLYRLWGDAVARSRTAVVTALRRGGLAVTYEVRPGVQCSVRRLIVDFIEEYGRHTGHADLLREAIDGRSGEDPPGRPYPFTLSG